MIKQVGLGFGLGVCLVSLLAAGPAAGAAAAPPPAPALAVVDMDRVAGEYRGMQDLNQQFQEFQKQQEAQIQRRQKNRLLFDDEQREYLDLSAPTAAPTPERDRRVTELEKLSDERSRRLLELGKKERTPEEDQEYRRLDQLYQQRTQEANALQADAQKAVVARYEEYSRIITDSLNAAVRAVAEAKKLPIVVRKEAVLFGGLDITADVIARLNQAPVPQVGSAPSEPRRPAASGREQPGPSSGGGGAAGQPEGGAKTGGDKPK